MTPEAAEEHALKVLAWLLAEEDLGPVFLGSTGASPEDLRTRAAEPEFLASVVDFLMMDDAWCIACGSALGVPPERFAAVRAALPGGAVPDWT
ncbi:DUF3572 family protein [Rhodobacterales bacterium HKCCE2091]|nr:DUF3572 family protein [Rhodobacterales bacterium HKCCE2091]